MKEQETSKKRFLFILGVGHGHLNQFLHEKFSNYNNNIDFVYGYNPQYIERYKKKNSDDDLVVLILIHGRAIDNISDYTTHASDLYEGKATITSQNIEAISKLLNTNKFIISSCDAGAIPRGLQKEYKYNNDLEVLTFGSLKHSSFSKDSINTLCNAKIMLENGCENLTELFAKISTYIGQTTYLVRIEDRKFSSIRRKARVENEAILIHDEDSSQLRKEANKYLEQYPTEDNSIRKSASLLEALSRENKERSLYWIKSILKSTQQTDEVILTAIKNQNLQIIKAIFDEIGDKEKISQLISQKDLDGLTLLHYAAEFTDEETFQLLVDNSNAEAINALDDNNETILHKATKRKQDPLEIVKVILSINSNLIDIQNHDGFTALHYALNLKRSETAKILLESGAKIYLTTKDKHTAIHFASARNEVEIIKFILKEYNELKEAEETHNIKEIEDIFNFQDTKGNTALHYAAANKHDKITKPLLDNFPNLAYQINENGETALHIAIRKGNKKAIQELSKFSKARTIRNIKGYAPFHLAIFTQDYETIKTFLEDGFDPNIQDAVGNTPLHFVVMQGDANICYLLLEYGADIGIKNDDDLMPPEIAQPENNTDFTLLPFDLQQQNESIINLFTKYTDSVGNSLLNRYIHSDNIEVVNMLLKIGARVDIPNRKGQTAIDLASDKPSFISLILNSTNLFGENHLHTILHGDKSNIDILNTGYLNSLIDKDNENILKLLQYGINPNTKDIHGNTALHIAATSLRSREAFLALMEYGANIFLKNNQGKTALDIAYDNKRNDIAGLLLDLKDNDGNSLLHKAVIQNDLNTTTILLKLGVDVSLKNNQGKTALDMVYEDGLEDIVNLLINFQDKNGNSLLHEAALQNDLSTTYMLLQFGANPNAKNNYGNTPLHFAAFRNNVEIFGLLLEYGSMINARNDDEFTVPEMALNEGNNEIIDFIIKQQDDLGNSFLHYFISRNDIRMTAALLAIDSPIDLKNKQGKTPLDLAAKKEDITQFILSCKDNSEKGYLHLFSASVQDLETAIQLLRLGANPNAQDAEGNTPLHVALYNNNKEVIPELIGFGARIEIKNKQGQAPIDIAEKDEALKKLLGYQENSIQEVPNNTLSDSKLSEKEGPASNITI